MAANFTYATLDKGTRNETRVRRCVYCGQPTYYPPGNAPGRPCMWQSEHNSNERKYTGPAA